MGVCLSSSLCVYVLGFCVGREYTPVVQGGRLRRAWRGGSLHAWRSTQGGASLVFPPDAKPEHVSKNFLTLQPSLCSWNVKKCSGNGVKLARASLTPLPEHFSENKEQREHL